MERKEEEESDQVLVRVLISHSSALARGRVQRLEWENHVYKIVFGVIWTGI